MFVIGVQLYTVNANHTQSLPDMYWKLDKSNSEGKVKPWNELARNFDPKMSDSEYDAMRSQYFNDYIDPYIKNRWTVGAAREAFMDQTERPWVWNRHPSRGEPSLLINILFALSLIYLIFIILKWIWRHILRPSKTLIYEQGLVGFGKVILHGRRGKE